MAKTYSYILVGLEVLEVEVECIIGAGFSGLHILGLKSDIARDMRERVRSALESIGIFLPAKRVVVNLSAYEIFRLSRSPLQELDFAVAAAIILALFEDQKIFLPQRLKECFAGELTLSGSLKSVQNDLIYKKIISEDTFDGYFAISSSSQMHDYNFYEYNNLLDWLNERKHNLEIKTTKKFANTNFNFCETNNDKVCEIVHQILKLRKNPQICVAILISAAGPHNLLLGGEPGIGKTYSIQKIVHFLSPMDMNESIETQLIYSQKNPNCSRPLRIPHHSSSTAAIIGGQSLKPGEATLAHNGVLLLDEIAEFSRNTLEALREPLDSKRVELSRSAGHITYPANFLLCATTNPCPCGYLFSKTKPCRCLPHLSKKYLAKLSGPLLDRFDLKLWIFDQLENTSDKDIFSSYISSLDKKEIVCFVKNFLSFQKESKNLKRNKIADMQTFDMKNTCQYLNDYGNEKLSIRGQYQVIRLQETFQNVFPTLIDDRNFTKDIFKYRSFSKIIENDILN